MGGGPRRGSDESVAEEKSCGDSKRGSVNDHQSDEDEGAHMSGPDKHVIYLCGGRSSLTGCNELWGGVNELGRDVKGGGNEFRSHGQTSPRRYTHHVDQASGEDESPSHLQERTTSSPSPPTSRKFGRLPSFFEANPSEEESYGALAADLRFLLLNCPSRSTVGRSAQGGLSTAVKRNGVLLTELRKELAGLQQARGLLLTGGGAADSIPGGGGAAGGARGARMSIAAAAGVRRATALSFAGVVARRSTVGNLGGIMKLEEHQ